MVLVRRIVLVIVGLCLLAVAIVYGGTEMLFRRHIGAELPAITAATDPLEIAEGTRLAYVEGCRECHGANGEGRVMVNDPMIGRIIAPSLARVAADANDGQLARAIRHGIGIDARPLYVMPTEALNLLSDQDVSRIMGWIRSLPVTNGDIVGKKKVGPLGRVGVLVGQFKSSVNLEGGQPKVRPADVGAYFARTACLECHALNEERPVGAEGDVAPALAPIVAAYDPAALKTLLRTGKAMGDREVGMMSVVSRAGLFALTDPEIEALQAWLRGQAGQ